MNAAEERTGIMIITDLYNLTNSMVRQIGDSDYLVECVDKRQKLMDEYDAYKALHPDEDITEIKKVVKDILVMDQRINASLNTHKREVKEKLSGAQTQQKAMGYASNYMSSSGSYMNYKK
ncbi:MAG: flagellar protein FliT [Oscillospiraceae bacterium]|jgi:hypothetical protein|nr:flagellar protein FliT [Oscillospiraceae bacterium]